MGAAALRAERGVAADACEGSGGGVAASAAGAREKPFSGKEACVFCEVCWVGSDAAEWLPPELPPVAGDPCRGMAGADP